MSKTSPTQRSLEYLRADGYIAQVVERYCPHSRKRIDLFGVIDIVAVREGTILGVQTTSTSNLSARVTKSLEEPRLQVWLSSGARFILHGWSKKGKRGRKKTWQVVVKEITLGDQ